MSAAQWLTWLVLLGVGAVFYPSAYGLMLIVGRVAEFTLRAVTR